MARCPEAGELAAGKRDILPGRGRACGVRQESLQYAAGGWESLRHAAGRRESLWRAAEGGPGRIAMTRCREAGELASWKQEILPCGGRACGVRAGELAACGREAGKLEARCWEAGELAACGR